jgi:MoxR-like ATPase
MANPNVNLQLQQILQASEILEIRKQISNIRLDQSLEDSILKIVDATRQPEKYGLEQGLLRFGASPRATINLALASKAMALMEGRDYVNSADIRCLSPEILRHRIGLTYRSSSSGLSNDSVIDDILQRVLQN